MKRIVVPFFAEKIATLEKKLIHLPVKNDEQYSKETFTIYGQTLNLQTATYHDIARWQVGASYRVEGIRNGGVIWYSPEQPGKAVGFWHSIHRDALGFEPRDRGAKDIYEYARKWGYTELVIKLIGFERIDVREIDLHTAKLSGFEDQIELWAAWAAHNDPQFVFRRHKAGMFSDTARRTIPEIQGSLKHRPARLWEAWQTTIERV